MKVKTYSKAAKNARAVNQVTAWLKAANISVEPSQVSGCDLAVQIKGSKRQVDVKIVADQAEVVPAQEHLLVLAAELTSKHADVALKAFHQITTAVGHGTPNPIADRGPEPEKKLHYDDNFELVSMRHKEFRRVPNPSTEELLQYERVIKKACGRFMYINKIICARHGLQFDDCKTYAQIWTCNYLGLFKVTNPTQNDNERKLYAYLCQRFAEFASMLCKKEKNCIPDPQTASIATLGRVSEARSGSGARRGAMADDDMDTTFEDHFEAELDAEVDGEVDSSLSMEPVAVEEDEFKRDQRTEAARRKWAKGQLADQLAVLPHDKMVEVLEYAAGNNHLNYDARLEARKQLRIHRQTCSSCLSREAQE